LKQHNWVKGSLIFDTFKTCSECGLANNPENIGKECKPLMIKYEDLPKYKGKLDD